MTNDAAYFRQQAERHKQLAMETTDPATAKALRIIAEEYTLMAVEREARTEPELIQFMIVETRQA